jgi:type III restriction enzyme
VLWLVPSTTIRDQTLQALRQPGHPYRAPLEAAYGQALTVLDLEATPTLAPQDFGRKTIVLVATMQSFRVRQTQGRNVYAFAEDFDAHFRHFAGQGPSALERVTQDDLDDPAQGCLRASDLGRVKHSLANLLALARPIVIVDEAHNAKTDTTFATLERIAPSVILELTATPIPRRTNVLYSVGARELQAEDMVKLPVMLAEHADWKAAVRDAVLGRRQLEAEAAHESPDVLRPIVLFQAQDRSGAVTPEVLRQHLLDEAHASADEIVIATGDQRGLDGVDLFDRRCPVRHVITVEALKEGWDCSFAYVLCSLQNVRSAKDVEQLLGRVLRMPYARRRRSPALNRAYAHVIARSFSEAAGALVDRMVANMGFEALEAAALLQPEAATLPLFDETAPAAAPAFALTIELPAQAAARLVDDPDIELSLQPVPADGGDGSDGDHAENAADGAAPATVRVTLRGEITERQLGRLVQAAGSDAKVREAIARQVQQHNERLFAARAPAQRGLAFGPVPRLCLQAVGAQGELHLFERDTLDEVVDFDLTAADPRPELPGFALVEQSSLFEIYVDERRLNWRAAADPAQLSLDTVQSGATEDDLLHWLAAQVRRPALGDAAVRRWCALLLAHLLRDKGLSLTGLLRSRHALALAAMRRLDALIDTARRRGFEQMMLIDAHGLPWELGVSPEWPFRFTPGRYPARHPYSGRYRFQRHYFELIHALKAQGEEFECARVLDGLPGLRWWVRNIEQQPTLSFWLPTATDYFYPDFVAELDDGRVLVVEYKGEAYATNDDSREKRAVGAAWQRAAKGQAVFVMVERELNGQDVQQQLLRAIGR